MTDATYDIGAATPQVSTARPGDFLALMKPRVMSLVVFTAFIGMVIAPGHVNPVVGFVSLLAIAVGAGASGALNMWYDADIDAVMARTSGRPIPSGRVLPGEALAFGLVMSVLSVMVLGIVSNWLAAGILAFTIFFYAVVYTMWLKRWTPQNIVIGGAAGAFPPMLGCAAASGSVTLESALLFAIVFIWTPPHFWALALVKSGDYARAGVPMMPNVKGPDHTRTEILIYALILAPVGLSPAVLGGAGVLYGLAASLGGAAMVGLAWRVYEQREGRPATRAAMQLFGFSIVYLFTLFAVLGFERLIARALGWGA